MRLNFDLGLLAVWLLGSAVLCGAACGGEDRADRTDDVGSVDGGSEPSGERDAAAPGRGHEAAGRGSSQAGKSGGAGKTGAAGRRGGGAAAGKSGAAGAAGATGDDATAGSGGQSGNTDAGTGGSSAAAGSGGEPAAAPRCGTRGGVQCAADELCNYDDSECGATDKGGVCSARPQACTDQYQPICGCDNRTYGNACGAHAAGVSVKRDGMCTPEECTTAGGRTEYSNGATIPECQRGEAQWSISGGREQVICCLPMAQPGHTCGGIAALTCEKDQFCNYETSAGGQGCDGKIADAGGVCETTPMACTREFAPVCGCDHRTYDNRCVAHSAGVSAVHEGACTEEDCKIVGGRVAYGQGPAPMCNAGEKAFTSVVGTAGSMPIEGALCCVPE